MKADLQLMFMHLSKSSSLIDSVHPGTNIPAEFTKTSSFPIMKCNWLWSHSILSHYVTKMFNSHFNCLSTSLRIRQIFYQCQHLKIRVQSILHAACTVFWKLPLSLQHYCTQRRLLLALLCFVRQGPGLWLYSGQSTWPFQLQFQTMLRWWELFCLPNSPLLCMWLRWGLSHKCFSYDVEL